MFLMHAIAMLSTIHSTRVTFLRKKGMAYRIAYCQGK